MLRLTAAAMSELELIGDSGSRGVIINTASVAAYDGQIAWPDPGMHPMPRP